MRLDVRLYLLLCALSVSLGCGGGGEGKPDPCTALRIAGGNECEVRPLSVAAVISDLGYCSGIFVSTRHVVTAAHCMPPAGAKIIVATAGYSEETTTQQVHPRYTSFGISPYDIAVVTIANDAPVIPAPIVVSRGIDVGEKVVAYGYGLDENGDGIVERVENGGMPLKATYLNVESVNAESIRTISDGGGDTCQGDSGGPVVAKGLDDRYGLVAVVRSGPNTCEPDVGIASDNTNIQADSVRDFVLAVVGDVGLN
jgi:trypsin